MKKRWLTAMAVVAVCFLAWATAPVWLSAVGRMLVDSDGPPQSADAILVLAGDYRGGRLMTGCELLRQGVAPVALVSGPIPWYGIDEADAAVHFASRNGCDVSRLKPVYFKAHSTVEEAEAFAPVLRRMGIRNIVIVTSSYHTARAGRIFRRVLGDEVRLTMVGSADQYFSPDRWWKTREGQKTMFLEVTKTLADWVGL